MAPSTDLNSPKDNFVGTEDCQVALNIIKVFRLYVDSSDTGIGAS